LDRFYPPCSGKPAGHPERFTAASFSTNSGIAQAYAPFDANGIEGALDLHRDRWRPVCSARQVFSICNSLYAACCYVEVLIEAIPGVI
jgi:hypothetical protein